MPLDFEDLKQLKEEAEVTCHSNYKYNSYIYIFLICIN